MCHKLKCKFSHLYYYQDNFTYLQNLHEKTLSIEEYTREFEKLMVKWNIQEKGKQNIAWYIEGLTTKFIT